MKALLVTILLLPLAAAAQHQPSCSSDSIAFEYYSNGQKKRIKPYRNGRMHGISLGFYDNGAIRDSVWFKNDEPVLVKEYYPLGQLKRYENLNAGCYSAYDTNGNMQAPASRYFELAQPKYGLDSLQLFISKNFYPPPTFTQSDVSGSVLVQLTVNIDESIGNVNVVRGLEAQCDAEAIRLASLTSGMWKPAVRYGEPCVSHVTISIPFVNYGMKKKL